MNNEEVFEKMFNEEAARLRQQLIKDTMKEYEEKDLRTDSDDVVNGVVVRPAGSPLSVDEKRMVGGLVARIRDLAYDDYMRELMKGRQKVHLFRKGLAEAISKEASSRLGELSTLLLVDPDAPERDFVNIWKAPTDPSS
jgi:hypothetical protein